MTFDTFPSLAQWRFLRHAFTRRTAEDTRADDYPLHVVEALGFPRHSLAAAEQTHGNGVAAVAEPAERIPLVDALITRSPNLPLVIRCADCAAIFLVDPQGPAIGLAHSGKAGTLANIAGKTVAAMQQQFGTDPANCLALVSPSIGPCHYEMDLWSGIEQQLRSAGIGTVHNPRICTACHLDKYYSYRAEKGKTGRMLAVLAIVAP